MGWKENLQDIQVRFYIGIKWNHEILHEKYNAQLQQSKVYFKMIYLMEYLCTIKENKLNYWGRKLFLWANFQRWRCWRRWRRRILRATPSPSPTPWTSWRSRSGAGAEAEAEAETEAEAEAEAGVGVGAEAGPGAGVGAGHLATVTSGRRTYCPL